MAAPLSSLPAPRRILVRGVNWLGDAVMATPALLRLRERFPDAHITLLTPAKIEEIWRHHPAVNETLAFAPEEKLFSVSKRIRAGKFDLALVLPNSPRSALEVWLGRVPWRVGGARPWRNWFLTHAIPARAGVMKMRKRSVEEIRRLVGGTIANSQSPIAEPSAMSGPSAIGYRLLAMEPSGSPPPGSPHQVHDFLHLVAALGANAKPLPPALFVTPEEIEAVRIKFSLAESGTLVFGLNPGAEYGPAKRWPAERFVATAGEIQRRTGCAWLVLGGPSDTAIANEIYSGIVAGTQNQSLIHNLAGRLSLRELMAALKLCRVLLTNDTGPMHVAAALGTAVAVPFGSTSPELTAPGLPGDPRHRLLKSDAPCSPCFLRECPIDFRCMKGIEVARMVEAVLEAGAL